MHFFQSLNNYFVGSPWVKVFHQDFCWNGVFINLHTSFSINLPLSCCVDKCAMINTDTDRQTVLLLSFQVFLIKAHVMSRDYCDTATELQKWTAKWTAEENWKTELQKQTAKVNCKVNWKVNCKVNWKVNCKVNCRIKRSWTAKWTGNEKWSRCVPQGHRRKHPQLDNWRAWTNRILQEHHMTSSLWNGCLKMCTSENVYLRKYVRNRSSLFVWVKIWNLLCMYPTILLIFWASTEVWAASKFWEILNFVVFWWQIY